MECLVRPITESKEHVSKADANYTKACKEVEDALRSQEKAQKDPDFVYNLAEQRRVRDTLKKTQD